MSEWLTKKLIFYSKNKMYYRFKILNLFRKVILRFYDPIIRIQIGSKFLFINFSHQLPLYLAQNILYDTALTRILNNVREKDKNIKFIDVGANIGDTVAMVKSSRNNIRFLCVEANSTYAALLKKNYKEDSSVIIEEVFCGDTREVKTIKFDANGSTATVDQNSASGEQVNFFTLDEIMKKHSEFSSIDFIKVDTDGFDYKVLRGATEILKNQQPLVFFELDKSLLLKNREDIMSIFDLFSSNYYDNFILYDNYGFLIGIFDFTELHIVKNIIDYLYNKKMYLDVLMVKNEKLARRIFESEAEAISLLLKD